MGQPVCNHSDIASAGCKDVNVGWQLRSQLEALLVAVGRIGEPYRIIFVHAVRCRQNHHIVQTIERSPVKIVEYWLGSRRMLWIDHQ